MSLIKKFYQNKIFYITAILFLALFSSTMGKTSEIETYAIVTTLGIDVLNDKIIEVSASILTPKSASNVNDNLQAVSAQGQTINNALYNLGIKLGKKIGMAHCEAIILSNGVFEDNALHYLDFFVRTNNMTTNAVVVNTNGMAKDLIEALSDAQSPYSLSLFNFMDHDDHFLFAVKMNVENFFKAYYGRSGVAIMSVYDIKNNNPDEADNGSEPTTSPKTEPQTSGDINISSPNTGSSNSSFGNALNEGETLSDEDTTDNGKELNLEEDSDIKYINFQGNLALIKNGKKLRELNKEEVDILRLIHPYVRTSFINIESVNMSDFKEGLVTLEIFDKQLSRNAYFNNGIPVFKQKVKLFVKFDEVMGDFYNESSVSKTKNFLYPEIVRNATEKLKSNLSVLISNSQEYKADVLGIYDMFHRFHNKEWKEYIKGLESEEDFLSSIIYELDVEMAIKF